MLSSGTTGTLGAVGVDGLISGGVDIGWADARGACELWGHTELDTHELPDNLYSLGKRIPRMSGDKR